jgi:uncharacterized membrane protein YecN with MAPEG domain
MLGSLIYRLFSGPNRGYWVLVIGAIIIAARATYYDIFIDETDSGHSDVADERRGVKATWESRLALICICTGLCAFAFWKMLH